MKVQVAMIVLTVLLLAVTLSLGKVVFVVAWTVGFSCVFGGIGLWLALRVIGKRR